MREPRALFGAIALVVLGLAVPTTAHAATCTITNYSPHTVVVGYATRVTFAVRSTGCETQQAKNWEIIGNGFEIDSRAPYMDVVPYENSEAGKPETVRVNMQMTDSKVFKDSFVIKRRTTWDKTNASPEPVKKGAKITIQGRLRIVNWHESRYDGYANRTVAVEFRTSTGTYKQVKTAMTTTGGYLKTTVTASTDGIWRLRYGGNSYAGPATMVGDSVDVK